MAAAFIDEELTLFLKARFVDEPSVVVKLMKYPGPCSALAARLDFALCLGLIRKGHVRRYPAYHWPEKQVRFMTPNVQPLTILKSLIPALN